MEKGSLAEFRDLQRQVEMVEWITTTPTWVEIPEQKNDKWRRSEISGGAGRSGSGIENPGQQRQREEESNPDVDPRLRVMERFRDFFCDKNRYGIMWPKGKDSRELWIRLHSKGNCTRDCFYSHAYLCGQTQTEYIRFLNHCRSGYKARNHNRKRKSSG